MLFVPSADDVSVGHSKLAGGVSNRFNNCFFGFIKYVLWSTSAKQFSISVF